MLNHVYRDCMFQAMELIQLNVVGRGVHLKKLNLSNCKITTTGATYLGEFIGGNKTVEELLVGCWCCKQPIFSICDVAMRSSQGFL